MEEETDRRNAHLTASYRRYSRSPRGHPYRVFFDKESTARFSELRGDDAILVFLGGVNGTTSSAEWKRQPIAATLTSRQTHSLLSSLLQAWGDS